MQTNPNDSDSINASEGGNVNVNRFTLPKDPREILVATLLAVSICVNVALCLLYKYDAQERDLDRYDFGNFIQKDFAPLKAKVDSQTDLIQAYGLEKELYGRSYHNPK